MLDIFLLSIVCCVLTKIQSYSKSNFNFIIQCTIELIKANHLVLTVHEKIFYSAILLIVLTAHKKTYSTQKIIFIVLTVHKRLKTYATSHCLGM